MESVAGAAEGGRKETLDWVSLLAICAVQEHTRSMQSILRTSFLTTRLEVAEWLTQT